MRNISYIEVQESIDRKKLIYREDVFDKIDTYFTYFLLILFLFNLYFIFFKIDINNANDKFYVLTLGTFFFAGLLVIFLKLTEKKLKILHSKYNQTVTREKLLSYADSRGLETYRNSKDCIVLNEVNDSFGHHNTSIFLLKDNLVYYCMLKDGFKYNRPAIISFFILKRDLKKLLT